MAKEKIKRHKWTVIKCEDCDGEKRILKIADQGTITYVTEYNDGFDGVWQKDPLPCERVRTCTCNGSVHRLGMGCW